MSCPPTSHTVKLMFLYSTVSTLNPAGSDSGGKLRHREPPAPLQRSPDGERSLLSDPPAQPTDGGDGGDNLPQFELVEDGGLPSSVQPHHQDPHLLLPNQALQQVPEDVAHGDGGAGSEAGSCGGMGQAGGGPEICGVGAEGSPVLGGGCRDRGSSCSGGMQDLGGSRHGAGEGAAPCMGLSLCATRYGGL